MCCAFSPFWLYEKEDVKRLRIEEMIPRRLPSREVSFFCRRCVFLGGWVGGEMGHAVECLGKMEWVDQCPAHGGMVGMGGWVGGRFTLTKLATLVAVKSSRLLLFFPPPAMRRDCRRLEGKGTGAFFLMEVAGLGLAASLLLFTAALLLLLAAWGMGF